MGQYYKPIILADESKLSVTEQLEREARGQEGKIIAFFESWDYDNGAKLMEHSWLGNNFVEAVEQLLAPIGKYHKQRVVWAGDYADEENDSELNLYCEASEDENDHLHEKPDVATEKYRYVINHTKKLFVDKLTIPVADTYTDKETGKVYEYRVHPLPLLTCEGNGRGGGDYNGEDEVIGSWARDIISVDNEVPLDYEQLEFTLNKY